MAKIYNSYAQFAVTSSGIQLRKRNSSQLIPWEDVHGITLQRTQYNFFGIKTDIRTDAAVFIKNHPPLLLDNRVKNLIDLLSQIKAAIYPRLLNLARNKYQAGELVNFGAVQINQSGLQIHRKRGFRIKVKSFTWKEISTVNFQSGQFIIQCAKRKYRISSWLIPNLEILMMLLKQDITR
jgi:hypothetical protein